MFGMTPRDSRVASRRSFLEFGGLNLLGLSLADMIRNRADANSSNSDHERKSVILVWLPGGPSHLEMYDLKPDAPLENRGEFRPIDTNVPGMALCEHLPRHAQIADKFTLIRSVSHTFSAHGGGHKKMLTGRDPAVPDNFVNDHPMVGSMVAKAFKKRDVGIPNYVAAVDQARDRIDLYAFGSAYLGPEVHPFYAVGNPNAATFEIKNLAIDKKMDGRLQDRLALLNGFDGFRREIDRHGSMQAMDEFNRQALSLLTGSKTREAFDLAQERVEVRERYGRNPWGQRALMARRLVERDVKFVTVVMETFYEGATPPRRDVAYNWDSHAVNAHLFNDMRERLPLYDQAITALIEDLYARGLDKQVLLVATGEFGRTPRITTHKGTQSGVMQPGRDHWPQAMSLLVSGGGMRMGQVIGATNSKGEHPVSRPLTPNDLWSTVFSHLGIDYRSITYTDRAGRPLPMLEGGSPIAELLG